MSRASSVAPSPATERTKLLSQPSTDSLTLFPRAPRKKGKIRRGSVWRRTRDWIGDSGVKVQRGRGVDDQRGWREWGREELSGDALVLPLLVITFSCALADALTLQQYATFATSMTGNTVLIAMRLMGTTEKSPVYAAVSLLGFVVAGLVFGQLGGVFGHRRRSWLIANVLTQIAILVANTILIMPSSPARFKPDGQQGWLYLLLLACQGGIQVTQAANAGARELPTAMMTTPYAAFISDPSLFTSGSTNDVTSRNRRFLYIVVFWLGAFTGAGLSKWAGMASATVAVVVCKVGVFFYIVLSAGEEGCGNQEDRDEVVIEEDGAETPHHWTQGGVRDVSPFAVGRSATTVRWGSDGRARRESRDERNVAM